MLASVLLAATLCGDWKPIDFANVARTLQMEPNYVSAPAYCLFLFGERGDQHVWAALDRSESNSIHHDVLYLDIDADGVLGEDGERFEGKVNRESTAVTFHVGNFVDPAHGDLNQATEAAAVTHKEFTITWRETSIAYSMQWRGEKATGSAYVPGEPDQAKFAYTLAEAPIFVPGCDRPLAFKLGRVNKLVRDESRSVYALVGNRGDRTGAFSCVDDDFLPKGEYLVATLIYTDEEARQKSIRTELKGRC